MMLNRIIRVVIASLIFGTISSAKTQPNIVFLLADDMGYGDLGCYGHPFIKTPNLDALAESGLRLTDCYAASSNCSPSRTGILTGRNPYRVGMYDYARFKPLHIPRDELTIAEILQDAGYQTMFAGKWHCSGDAFPGPGQPDPGDHGFDHWFANKSNFGQDPKTFYRNREAVGLVKGWMSEIVVDEAIDWLGNRDTNKPFMTMLWFSEPHVPVIAAEEFKQPYRSIDPDSEAAKSIGGGGEQVRRKPKEENRAAYYGCVSMLDHHIGRLINYLDEHGLRDNTLIIFTSDNGPEHRPATSFGTPGVLRGAKGHMHEGGIRVPGIINWPGRISPDGNASFPVCGTDFLPTLASIAGAKFKSSKPIDGINVWPYLLDSSAPNRENPIFWWLFHARGMKEVCMRVGDYKVLANMLPQREIGNNDAAPPDGMSIMDFIKHAELGDFTMYNLKDDISEQTNIASTEPERFDRLRKQLVRLHEEIRAEGPVYNLQRKSKK